jgi:predicted TIM-barrel fold metal-dependent hydrolase
MAKSGFRVMDSDLHTMEPDGLWEKYLEEPFRNSRRASRVARRTPNQPIIEIGDLAIAEMSKRPRTAVVGKELQKRAFERHPHYAVAHARGYDSETHVQAMDIEGIDVAVIYGTRGRQVLMHDDLQPEVAAALARAHNNWTRDFCAYNPERMKFAAQVAFHDPALAAKEARRAVRELGAVAVIGNPNPINGRHVHDPSFEPLWETIEELGVPVGFHPTGQSSLRDDIARRYVDQPNGRVIGVAGRNPVELMYAFASMAAGGVLERHPRLRCAFLEGTCGWLLWWLWRLDEAWEKFGPAPRSRSRSCRASTTTGSATSPTDADEKVSSRSSRRWRHSIVFSTDYPHSDGLFPHAIEEFVGLEGVSDKTKAKILWDNCPGSTTWEDPERSARPAQVFSAATAIWLRISVVRWRPLRRACCRQVLGPARGGNDAGGGGIAETHAEDSWAQPRSRSRPPTPTASCRGRAGRGPPSGAAGSPARRCRARAPAQDATLGLSLPDRIVHLQEVQRLATKHALQLAVGARGVVGDADVWTAVWLEVAERVGGSAVEQVVDLQQVDTWSGSGGTTARSCASRPRVHSPHLGGEEQLIGDSELGGEVPATDPGRAVHRRGVDHAPAEVGEACSAASGARRRERSTSKVPRAEPDDGDRFAAGGNRARQDRRGRPGGQGPAAAATIRPMPSAA